MRVDDPREMRRMSRRDLMGEDFGRSRNRSEYDW